LSNIICQTFNTLIVSHKPPWFCQNSSWSSHLGRQF